jgi:hypothetical protein
MMVAATVAAEADYLCRIEWVVCGGYLEGEAE